MHSTKQVASWLTDSD